MKYILVPAGARRFRPIILTSLTTFAGLVPLLMDQSLQALSGRIVATHPQFEDGAYFEEGTFWSIDGVVQDASPRSYE